MAKDSYSWYLSREQTNAERRVRIEGIFWSLYHGGTPTVCVKYRLDLGETCRLPLSARRCAWPLTCINFYKQPFYHDPVLNTCLMTGP